jgi:hypothetical protein
VDRFLVRNVAEKSFHLIPIVVGGPGTGKSRFLDEVERLLTLKANNSDNEDIRNAFSNLVVDNTSYGNGCPANKLDLSMGIRNVDNNNKEVIGAQVSLAMRILFAYFRPQPNVGEFTFSSFRSLCNTYSTISAFTLDTALQVVMLILLNERTKK